MNRYARQLQEHLQEHRPKEYARLQVSGQLVSHLESQGKEAEDLSASIQAQYLQDRKLELAEAEKLSTLGDNVKMLRLRNEALMVAEEFVTREFLLPRAEEDDSAIGPTGAYEDRTTESATTRHLEPADLKPNSEQT